MRILILGDVIGKPGIRAVVTSLKNLAKHNRADMVIVNAENSNDGFGVTQDIAHQLFAAGVDVITTGNHVWHSEDSASVLNSQKAVLRPDNYPTSLAGTGVWLSEGKQPVVAVLNLQGRDRLLAIDCPFQKARTILSRIHADYIIVDFHAEAVQEKEALAHYLDGQVTVIYGTHTHVQTMDERIMPHGTAYITDIGACLPEPSVIGFNPFISVQKALTQLALRDEVEEGRAVIHGIIVETAEAPRAASIERILYRSLV